MAGRQPHPLADPGPERTLRVLRALWLICREPDVLRDLREQLEVFGAEFRSVGADRRRRLELGDRMLEWARRNRHRLSMVIERGLGGHHHDRGY